MARLALISIGMVASARAMSAMDGEGSAAAPEPYTATYEVVFHGVEAGESTFQLEGRADSTLRYVSRSNARGLFRLAFGHEIVQDSVMRLSAGRLRPLEYRGDDGSPDARRDVSLTFDWSTGRIHGIEKQQPVDIGIVPDVQDPLSAQMALVVAASRGAAPLDYQLVNEGHFDTYRTVAEGRAHVATPAGEFETVVFRSRRDGAKHSVRIWLAPSLGFIPIQAEQLREDKRVWVMRAKHIAR